MRSAAASVAASSHHSHFRKKQNNTGRHEPTGPKLENSRKTPTKSKWQPSIHSPLPPPPLQILHLPHSTRRRSRPSTLTSSSTTTAITSSASKAEYQKSPPLSPCTERREALFDQERSLDKQGKDEPLPETESTTFGTPSSGESGIEKCRLRDENLRYECNFLKTERVLDSLVSARRKIDGSDTVDVTMEESEGLTIARRRYGGQKEAEIGWSNFDKKALLLRRRLQEMNVREMMPKDKEKKVGAVVSVVDRSDDHNNHDNNHDDVVDVISVKQSLQSVSDVSNSLTIPTTTLPEVEMLRRKMEIVSKGMLEKIEAYGTLLTTSATSSRSGRIVRKGAVALSKTVKVVASSGHRHHYQKEECWGKCKEVVRRIMEEVKVETEQWSDMQEMLKQVREEMDDLHCSRDFWERCAIQSNHQLQSTNTKVMEWTQRARLSEQRAAELQRQVMELRSEVEGLKEERSAAASRKEKLRCAPSSAQQKRRPLREICNLTTVKTNKNL